MPPACSMSDACSFSKWWGQPLPQGRGAPHCPQALLHRAVLHKPFGILKYAMTLDGKIATSMGHAAWISSPLSRQHVFETRSRSDAVVVGGQTVRILPSRQYRSQAGCYVPCCKGWGVSNAQHSTAEAVLLHSRCGGTTRGSRRGGRAATCPAGSSCPASWTSPRWGAARTL